MRAGTAVVDLERLTLALASDSRLVRLLQLADVVAGWTVAHVAGEDEYSPPRFATIRPLLREDAGRIGGIGLKLHPDFRYVNLYHCLLGDAFYWREGVRVALGPAARLPGLERYRRESSPRPTAWS
jgi:hypothetical protein